MQNVSYSVAVVGATGAVGQQMLKTLEERDFPIGQLKLLSSKRSAGTKITFKGEEYTVEEATPDSFEGVQVALFSAGGSVSKKLAPEAVKRGAIVVDNTSAYRMDPEVPLVVPEVNEADLKEHKGIIANPNCSTIQMVVALEPLREKYGLKKVVVSTYQAVSGAGLEAIEEMKQQTTAILNGEEVKAEVLPCSGDKKHYQIAFNAVPQIDLFQENGYTFEEMKMINETKKIMHMEQLEVAATCVRLPVETGHSESVYIETDKGGASVTEIKELLASSPGVTLQDDPDNQIYPMASTAVGKNDVFVGRIRRDLDRDNGYHMWIVSDNLLKGAAWNSVQIAESLIKLNLLG
ncbi:aspartate-semialdehyde dehydrogenase [Alkalihalobacillus alcalophilus ATCC 27647 = CGMCC 1.3604]|uniref:Aspartate-semialdehyde dehydrogenase n=1 Tax=Alkalihalobacillus alcalophilus ATCC 27647 = CGMCC 1.3604 TaxID=1218173 RepID=A0A094WNX6_ALKAL|nr:aspartate-semialdehyde dehydrogenase [Alkalihalobacillus alcalophilus]KGA98546.1 aspartate-semialdehyde dehydrogenase [Alkalihalobacillus alcalophilus ATCC 27647 = CGMCC 1.3604]MED1562697.1 aspartate-semialdehyde dehydrogenase [Alkalihalobacillus alcalophilus]THG88305.1 aspartate-semialdehyde dehydrogenase [Alkalihalobacillus alcalophilus ATCC 27647 = CGMCC 1.3604]